MSRTNWAAAAPSALANASASWIYRRDHKADEERVDERDDAVAELERVVVIGAPQPREASAQNRTEDYRLAGYDDEAPASSCQAGKVVIRQAPTDASRRPSVPLAGDDRAGLRISGVALGRNSPVQVADADIPVGASGVVLRTAGHATL